MKKEQPNQNLTEAEEAKIALQELSDITLDKYIKETKQKSNEQKKTKHKAGGKSV